MEMDDELIRPFRTTVKGNRILEYFRVFVPEDLYDTERERLEYGIEVARELAEMFRIPCTWYAYRLEGETVYVRRESHKT